jgi:membrane-bound serine protease (ClpP class)
VLSLLLGSMMLIDSPLPEMQVGLRLIVPITLATSAIMLFLVRLAVKAQRARSVTGTAGMIDEVGRALTPIDAGGTGRVQTHGEIWTAVAAEPVAAGEAVRVTGVHGLTLTVKPESPARP